MSMRSGYFHLHFFGCFPKQYLAAAPLQKTFFFLFYFFIFLIPPIRTKNKNDRFKKNKKEETKKKKEKKEKEKEKEKKEKEKKKKEKKEKLVGDVREWIDYEGVMDEGKFGPNGGLVECMTQFCVQPIL